MLCLHTTKLVTTAMYGTRHPTMQPLNADNEYSRKKLPDLWCLECHSTPITKAIAKGGLRLGKKMHSRHKKAGLSCTTCHNRVAHPGAERYYKLEAGRDSFKYKEDACTDDSDFYRCHVSEIHVLDTPR